MSKPKVSVIMPMYNAERYVTRAIESILSQTFGDFELLVINDGSTDRGADIVRSYKDPRIILLENKKNTGLVDVRNRGIRESKGDFIAMLDSDDIAHAKRLEYEVEILEKRPDIGLVATWVRVIDEAGDPTGVFWRETAGESSISSRLLFGNCITQSSVMMRRSIITENPYRAGFAPAEDYDLWVRIAQSSVINIIHEILVDYRSYGSSTSALKKEAKDKAVEVVVRGLLQKLNIDPTPEEYAIHRNNYKYQGNDLNSFISKREEWLKKILKANNSSALYPKDIFAKMVARFWASSLNYNDVPIAELVKRLTTSELVGNLSAIEIFKAIAGSLVRRMAR